MSELIRYFQNVNDIFWGDDVYRWWFYAAIVIILIFEKRKMVKRIYAVYPLCFLLVLLTPIFHKIMEKIVSGWQYYARLYSMLPIPYMLALSAIILMDLICSRFDTKDAVQTKKTGKVSSGTGKLKAPVIKLVLTAGVCALIIFGGTNVYEQDWMGKAENIVKVPNEAIAICQKVHQDGEVMIAVPYSLVTYIRQVDAGIYMPYGRDMNDLGQELSKDQPDPEYAMTEAGKEGCDYIVVPNNQDNLDRFAEQGWDPYEQIGRYLIYEVKGVKRRKYIHDEQHRRIQTLWLDEEGKPDADSQGLVSVHYEFDQDNRKISETYYDQYGQPVIMPLGDIGIRCTYTDFSNQITSMTYIGADYQPINAIGLGYAEIRYEYDGRRRLIRESYYDVEGKPVECEKGYHSIARQYDEAGNIISEKCLDPEGQEMPNVNQTDD